MTPLGWAALALGALALAGVVVLLRRLSAVEPDFSRPGAPPAPGAAPEPAPAEER